MLATKQPTNSRMSLANGMLPGSTVINKLKRKLGILEISGHNSACVSLGGYGGGGGRGDWGGEAADSLTVLLIQWDSVKDNLFRLVICFETENLLELISLYAISLWFMICSCGYQFTSVYVTKSDNLII
jgi:hypothetical protein